MGAGPFPAVVLLQGSGPSDRDETQGPNKPFRDLAWGLGSRGIAVLRYDKRSNVHNARFAALPRITVREEIVDDALAAVALLRRTGKIDPRRVYVLGHSLGGTVAPRIGKADPAIAGLIVMAGLTRPLGATMVDQLTYLAELDGAVSEDEKKQIDAVREEVRRIEGLKEGATGMVLQAPASYWLDLRGYDPAGTAKQLAQPLLILQGGRDYQVTMEDFQGWQKALAGRKDVTFKSYPKLNHFFLEGEGRSTPLEYAKAGHVAQAVIEDIAGWILKRPAA